MKSKRKLKKYFETNDNGNTTIQNLWDAVESRPTRAVHSKTSLPQKNRNISNKQPNLPPKRIRKGRANKT